MRWAWAWVFGYRPTHERLPAFPARTALRRIQRRIKSTTTTNGTKR